MPDRLLNRRDALHLGIKVASSIALGSVFSPAKLSARANQNPAKEFDVHNFGAVGDGLTLDSPAIQQAIDAAATVGGGARVLLRGGKHYLSGVLQLRGGIDFHLADDAELLASTRREDYKGGAALITALDNQGLRITGTGSINGRSREFMTSYNEEREIWRPADFRPRLLMLTACKDLEISDILLRQAPSWTVHLLGCERVLIDRVKILNTLDVPNCDGIDPDHCRDVEIRNCQITCGDDAIVVKATRQEKDYGPCAHILVKDCMLQTQDSGVKIGTETTQDIHDIRFERCKIISSARGICIQLRDEGSVYDVDFSDIEFVSRYHSDPWWGRGEAISLTAIPRGLQTKIGTIHDIRIRNIIGRAENSIRINGTPESRIRDVRLENVALTLDRWTKYQGGLFDNRPTSAYPGIEPHGTPGISVRYADKVNLDKCRIDWGKNLPEYFTHALEAQDVNGLAYPGFVGTAAHPERDQAIAVR